jgi:hypothetical protein
VFNCTASAHPWQFCTYTTWATVRKKCRFLWSIAGLTLGIYTVVQDLNLPLILQPQLFGFFTLLSWGQCMYYGAARSRTWCLVTIGGTLSLWGALEAVLAFSLRVRVFPFFSLICVGVESERWECVLAFVQTRIVCRQDRCALFRDLELGPALHRSPVSALAPSSPYHLVSQVLMGIPLRYRRDPHHLPAFLFFPISGRSTTRFTSTARSSASRSSS